MQRHQDAKSSGEPRRPPENGLIRQRQRPAKTPDCSKRGCCTARFRHYHKISAFGAALKNFTTNSPTGASRLRFCQYARCRYETGRPNAECFYPKCVANPTQSPWQPHTTHRQHWTSQLRSRPSRNIPTGAPGKSPASAPPKFYPPFCCTSSAAPSDWTACPTTWRHSCAGGAKGS